MSIVEFPRRDLRARREWRPDELRQLTELFGARRSASSRWEVGATEGGRPAVLSARPGAGL